MAAATVAVVGSAAAVAVDVSPEIVADSVQESCLRRGS